MKKELKKTKAVKKNKKHIFDTMPNPYEKAKLKVRDYSTEK